MIVRTAALLLALPALAHADLTSAQPPAFRGAEGTSYAGFADWSGLAGGGALPDDPGTTAQAVFLTASDGPGFVASPGGIACSSATPVQFLVAYGDGFRGTVEEVVVQIAAPGIDTAAVTLAYVSGMSPGSETLLPAETVDLAPGERLFRFHSNTLGPLPSGVFGTFQEFGVRIAFPGPACLDELQLDVRHRLDGAFEPGCDPPFANSIGFEAGLGAWGSSVAADNRLTLVATGVPPSTFGIFLVSDTFQPASCPNGCPGLLCLGGTIARILPVQQAGPDASFSATLDLTALPFTPSVAVQPGSTWYFQGWYRDRNPLPTSDFTASLGVQFL